MARCRAAPFPFTVCPLISRTHPPALRGPAPGRNRGRPRAIRALHTLAALTGILFGAPSACAAAKSAWSAQVGLGYEATTGTTNTRTLDTHDRAHYEHALWGYTGRLSYDYAAHGGLVSANRLALDLQASRSLSGHKEDFFLATARYVHNPFDGYRHYEVESVGMGHRFLRHGPMRLKVDGGAGLRQNTYVTGRYNDVPVLRLGVNYRWQITKKSALTQRITVLGAATGTLLTSTTGLTAPISARLALDLSEIVDHYTSAPAGFKPTSTFTTLNLLYHLP